MAHFMVSCPLFNDGSIAAGDLNLDDNLDLIASNGGSVSIILGDGAGGFGAPTAFNISAKLTAVDDLNADGKLDIVAIPSGVETRYVTIRPCTKNSIGSQIMNRNGFAA